jgi:hypothetical protein
LHVVKLDGLYSSFGEVDRCISLSLQKDVYGAYSDAANKGFVTDMLLHGRCHFMGSFLVIVLEKP